MSFFEFLSALGREDLMEYIQQEKIDQSIHQLLLDQMKTYMFLGGMPAVIQQWLVNQEVHDCQRIQDELIESYRQDFHKYAKDRQIPHVTKVFENIPTQFGGKFMYSQIDSEVRSLYYKEALFLLSQAGIAHLCHHTSAQHQPLGAMTDERKFKVFFLDIGLAQRLLGLDVAQWLLNPVQWSNAGRIAEQLVAQELVAYSPPYKRAQLFYWHREAKSSNAEVDFVVVKEGNIIPVEVKSSVKGRLRSLYLFLEKYQNSPYGLKISEGLFNTREKLVEIPFYGIKTWMSDS
jgi:predicted AAA+ superfamily ATPase